MVSKRFLIYLLIGNSLRIPILFLILSDLSLEQQNIYLTRKRKIII